jgi:pilus assembly protein CpaB
MRLILLFVAIVVSLGAAFFVFQSMDDEPKDIVQTPQVTEQQVATVDVYVAREPIAVGDIIDDKLLDRQPWPAHLVLPEFATTAAEAPPIVGMVARAPFAKKEPIMLSKLANKDDPSFIAASLPAGKRAITIAADTLTGVGGFVYPGDRVDVLITHEIVKNENDQGEIVPVRMTETLLSDIRVLAVNQSVTGTVNEDGQRELPTNVTLEVSQSDAQRLRLAERDGSVSLILRSLEDRDNVAAVNPSASSDLTRVMEPSYFPVQYPAGQEYTPTDGPAFEAGTLGNTDKDDIIVVRGITVEKMEIKQP